MDIRFRAEHPEGCVAVGERRGWRATLLAVRCYRAVGFSVTILGLRPTPVVL